MFFDVLEHSLLHSLEHTLPLLPFLYLTYLLMELLERRAGGRMERIVRGAGKWGQPIGALLGILPQCGFSAMGAGLYAGRVITTGTLLSIFLSTSDEMLPLLISSGTPPMTVIKILGCKVVIAAAAGLAVDGVSRHLSRGEANEHRIVEVCRAGHCHCEERNIWLASLIHTLQIGLSVLAVSFALELTLELVGEEVLTEFLRGTPFLSCLLAALVGLLPNCASSVAITQLYIEGVLSAGAMLSGLLVGAGVGILVLLQTNKPLGDSLRVIGILFAVGLAAGVLFEALPLGTVLGL